MSFTLPWEPRRAQAGATPTARGQALVEFALVAPVLVLLFAAVVQFAVVFQTEMGLTNAVREAARQATSAPGVYCSWVLDQAKPVSGSGLLARNVQSFDSSRASVTVTISPVLAGTPTYQVITVAVTYGHPVFMPVIAPMTDLIDGTPDGRWTLSRSVEMRVDPVQETGPAPGTCTR
jgi:uncharacterized protein (UPF0333 family)